MKDVGYMGLSDTSLDNLAARLNQLEEDYVVNVLGYQIVSRDGIYPVHYVLVLIDED